MDWFTYYKCAGDKIVAVVRSMSSGADALNPGFVAGDADIETQYAPSGVLTNRPVQATMLVGQTLHYLPAPCAIYVGDKKYECGESVADLQFDQPGTYRVRVECWPYLDKEFTVENPAP